MDKRIEKILLTQDQIQEGIKRAAKWVNQKYQGKELIMIGILKGCLPFFGQLFSHITVDCLLDFLTIGSWEGQITVQTTPRLVQDITEDIENRHVLLVDEIIDSALTLHYIRDYLLKKYKPASIESITLLDKPKGRKIDYNPSFSCFQIENKFVVGYGCDYKGKLRNLPYVGIFKLSEIDKE